MYLNIEGVKMYKVDINPVQTSNPLKQGLKCGISELGFYDYEI